MDTTDHGFTPQQMAWLRRNVPLSGPAFDRPTLMWLIGGLTAIGVTVSGVLWTEIGSVREELRGEISSVREELRGEISSVRDEVRENRTAIIELQKGQAQIRAILEERLPRNL